MKERYKAIRADVLAKFDQCCGYACQNCPFVPRHEMGIEIDRDWVKFSTEHPESSYEDYLAAANKE